MSNGRRKKEKAARKKERKKDRTEGRKKERQNMDERKILQP